MRKGAAEKDRGERQRGEKERVEKERAEKDLIAQERVERERAEREKEREARQARVAPYRAQWLDDRFPSRLNAGQIVNVPITVKNNGAIPWTPGGDHPFMLGYRYYRNRRILSLGR